MALVPTRASDLETLISTHDAEIGILVAHASLLHTDVLEDADRRGVRAEGFGPDHVEVEMLEPVLDSGSGNGASEATIPVLPLTDDEPEFSTIGIVPVEIHVSDEDVTFDRTEADELCRRRRDQTLMELDVVCAGARVRPTSGATEPRIDCSFRDDLGIGLSERTKLD